ncbi:MAG TPA: hypothetical protein VKB86_15040 [Pyrinomonadaceae bacterium]|nr:hypothetical protein [Pyrinomonadaceae bacterium]
MKRLERELVNIPALKMRIESLALFQSANHIDLLSQTWYVWLPSRRAFGAQS